MKYGLGLLALLVLAGCADKEKIAQLQEQNTQLATDYDQLRQESSAKDEFIRDYTSTINQVYENLEKIREREGYIVSFSQDLETKGDVAVKEKILSNISSIDAYLQKSKKNLRDLQGKLKASQLKTAELEKMVESLNQTVQQKEQHIAELRQQVEQLNIKVAQVEEQLLQKEEMLEVQGQRLNTVFYVIGTEDELEEKGIVEKTGGFLGIGKTTRLADNLQAENFTRANAASVGSIPIYRRIDKVNILSPHPAESYHLLERKGDETLLEIVKPDEFWKMKHLVILCKG